MVAKKFQIHGVKITEKYICESQNWIFLLMGPSKNFSSGFYHHHTRQKEITHFLQAECFENLFFLSREGEIYFSSAERGRSIFLQQREGDLFFFSREGKIYFSLAERGRTTDLKI